MIAALWMRLPKKSWDLLQLYLVMRATKVGILKRSENLSPKIHNLLFLLYIDQFSFSTLSCQTSSRFAYVEFYWKRTVFKFFCWCAILLICCRQASKLRSLYMTRRYSQQLWFQSKSATCTLRLSMQHSHPLFTTNIAHWWMSWPLQQIKFFAKKCFGLSNKYLHFSIFRLGRGWYYSHTEVA